MSPNMGIDISALVAPLSEEEPSGPDLYADPDRQAIEATFERSVSDGGVSDAGEVDWSESINRILTQAEATRDLWLPVYLMRAAAQAGRFGLVVDGAELLARLVEERWADVHPRLDEVGFIGRKAPCESLTRIGEFLGPLQRAPLVSHPRLGSFCGEDLLRFADEGSSADNYGLFRALIEATPAEDQLELVAQVDRLIAAIRRTDQILTANADGDTSTNFEPTYNVIEKLRQAIKEYLHGYAVDEGGQGPEIAQGSASQQTQRAAPAGGPGFAGAINSRDDVARALDSICAYYARCEPASPVPFALRRAREWISLDFMAVLEDIAPGSLQEAATVLKSQRTSGDGSSWSSETQESSGSDESWT